jgi:hypothetical protein
MVDEVTKGRRREGSRRERESKPTQCPRSKEPMHTVRTRTGGVSWRIACWWLSSSHSQKTPQGFGLIWLGLVTGGEDSRASSHPYGTLSLSKALTQLPTPR